MIWLNAPTVSAVRIALPSEGEHMNTTKTDDYKKVFYPVKRSIQLSDKGILLESPHHMNGKGLPDHLKDVKRGNMGGFSKASKKRMREAILSKGTPEGFASYAVTLTIPGDDPLEPAQCKQLWENVHNEFRRLGYCGFWRIEIQERGMVHWHLLLCAPPESEEKIATLWLHCLDRLPKALVSVTTHQAEYINNALEWRWDGSRWLDAIDCASQLEDEGYTVDYKQRKHKHTLVLPLDRSLIVGAREHACDAVSHDNQSAWLRYINDHCTKAKQAQVLGFGGFRHWGYINKKLLPESSFTTQELSFPESVQLLRLISKWSRMRVKADCSFGYKLGYRSSRGRSGSSVWFGTPNFYNRAVRWAKEHPASTKLVEPMHSKYLVVSSDFWSVAELAHQFRNVVSNVRKAGQKLLSSDNGSGGSSIVSMLPPCSGQFGLEFIPAWVSALRTS